MGVAKGTRGRGKLFGMANPILLEAEGLCRRAADGTVLIDRASLTVRAGERLGIEGPTGSGKSVLLRALALLDPVDPAGGGTLRYRGAPVADRDVPRFRSRVSYLHQEPALLEGTVEESLRSPFELAVHRGQRGEGGRSFDRARAVELLTSLGRDASFLTKQRDDLSGGERQVTALVRLLQLEPEVLLLDEPTAALDPETTARVEGLLVRWVEAGERAAVWVSHDPAQARRLATRRLRVEGGRLVPEGSGGGGGEPDGGDEEAAR